jgi:hypothetical protein
MLMAPLGFGTARPPTPPSRRSWKGLFKN